MTVNYVLLSKQVLEPPTVRLVSNPSVTELQRLLSKFERQPVAFDFETYGLDATHPTGWVRSVGLANDSDCVAIDLQGAPSGVSSYLYRWLARQKLIAHNYVFDGAWITRELGKIIKPYCCTYGLLAQLANEDSSVSWSLKSAMTTILGWGEENTEDLDTWLRANKLKKSDMAKAPFEILGPYNALDAGATWQLFCYLKNLISYYSWGTTLWEYHQLDFLGEVCLLIEQQFSGIHIDVPKLKRYQQELNRKIFETKQEFLSHPEVTPVVNEFNDLKIKEIKDKEPEEFTKTGKQSARWRAWKIKLDMALEAQHFNIDSTAQLSWLFYQKLKLPVLRVSKSGNPAVDKKAVALMGPLGKILSKYRGYRDELKFVDSTLSLQREGVFHPQVKSIATVSGRLGGGVSG